MPLAVHVPVRIRIDARAGLDHMDWVEGAVAAAVGRALARSRRVVLAPRGDCLATNCLSPTFRWCGDDLQALPEPARRELESRISSAITEATDRSDISKFDGAAGGDPWPLSEPPEEPFDRRRYDPLLGIYRIPSYDANPDAPGVAHITFEDDPLILDPEPSPQFAFRVLSKQQIKQADWRALIREVVQTWGPLPEGAPRGLIVKMPRSWFVVIFTTPVSTFGFDSFGYYKFLGADKVPPFQLKTDAEPVPARATATRSLIAGDVGLRAFAAERFGPGIEAIFRDGKPKPETMSSAEYSALMQAAVDKEIDRRVRGFLSKLPKDATLSSAIVVEMEGQSVTLFSTPDDDKNLNWTGPANLLPVAFEVSGAKAKLEGREGEGGKGGKSGTKKGAVAGVGGSVGEGPQGAGDGTGDGDGGRHGGFIFYPEKQTKPGEKGAMFPPIKPSLFALSLVCESFEGEPKLDDLGDDAAGLRQAIKEIAYRLQIEPCCDDGSCYAANFAIRAATILGSRAAAISSSIGGQEPGGFTQPVAQNSGNLGALDFRPVVSPAIQFMRHLAGVVPRITALMRRIIDLYRSPEHRGKITGIWADEPVSWTLRFYESFSPAMDASVGEVLLTTCQSMLLQLLQTSRKSIDLRISKFSEYAPIFEQLMVTQLTDYAELKKLRDHLKNYERARAVNKVTETAGGDVAAAIAAIDPATQWLTASRALSSAFVVHAEHAHAPGAAYEIVAGSDGTVRVRDSHGTLWSEQDLEQALPMQRGMAEGIDPLIKQMTDIPEVLDRFKTNRRAIRQELWRVLLEMQANNEEMLGKARQDRWFCFRASRLSENIPEATVSGSRYALQGIHLQAHLAIGEFFLGDPYYARGIDYLFMSEEGRQALTGFGIMVGLAILAVLCPPAAFIVGVKIALHDVAQAKEKERLFGSMIDPELVLTRAEVEMELFAAYLGLALSLIPEAGTVVGAAGKGAKAVVRTGLRAGLRQGLRAGATAVGRSIARSVARQMLHAVRQDLLTAFVRELSVNFVMDQVIQKAMAPVLAHIEREAMIEESVGGPEGARFVLAVLSQEKSAGATVGLRGGLW